MSIKAYKHAVGLGIAIFMLIICNILTISVLRKSSEIVTPSDIIVSESEKKADDILSKSDETQATETTETTEATKSTAKNTAKISPYKIVVYLKTQSVAVYRVKDDGSRGKLEKCFTCSSGSASSPTPVGEFAIGSKHRWRWLQGNVYGQYCSRIHGHILFHSTPFLKEDPSTLKNEEYDKLGKPASLGCVRMCVSDCKWIYDNAPKGTPVSIVDEKGPYGYQPPKRKTDSAYNGWDPTDVWSKKNPYFYPNVLTSTTKSTTSATSATDAEISRTSSNTSTSATSASVSSTTEATAITSAAQPDTQS